MRAFVAVVEEGGLSAAARRLHVSQPALSQTIAGLERQLGVELLIRANTGVRPTSEDLGRGGAGPQGVSWSISGHDRGAFKTPGLRNVGLKSSFFHNGGKATLTDVVNFYARGGDFANPEQSSLIKRIGFSSQDINALVDFMQNGLTDCRVARELAPFDHPSLLVNNGADLPATGGGSC